MVGLRPRKPISGLVFKIDGELLKRLEVVALFYLRLNQLNDVICVWKFSMIETKKGF